MSEAFLTSHLFVVGFLCSQSGLFDLSIFVYYSALSRKSLRHLHADHRYLGRTPFYHHVEMQDSSPFRVGLKTEEIGDEDISRGGGGS